MTLNNPDPDFCIIIMLAVCAVAVLAAACFFGVMDWKQHRYMRRMYGRKQTNKD